ncbi:cytochrome c1 [Pigmentibacter sp. JX0631]|uniref:c-type cytochrome n=1 Tax=Pigmentibacter sp. JX0631 TaxID=2976982 RepID=UPI0024696F31|nr:c-type cytochrome [Pigmentibacter sp. JX0631]WGL59056.1 cytochrome c1 [Pigmentibacter sp. JX0631]
MKKICYKFFLLFPFFLLLPVFADANKDFLIDESLFKNLNIKESFLTTLDPLYKERRTFSGYNFLNILFQKKIDYKKYDLITFIAKDKFKISIPISFLEKYKPFLAIRDITLKNKMKWQDTRDGGRIINGGPYYLLWREEDKVPVEYWAFGIVEINLSTFHETYGASIPKNTSNEKVLKGFQVFQESCSACHSMNLIGGQLGLEMNVPKNFSEYYSVEYIQAYTKSPTSFRANAKMPPVKISEEQFNNFFLYLKEMKENKLCNNDLTCQNLMDAKLLKK